MRIFPAKKDDWIALVLFPFKAYVVMAFPFLKLFGAYSATVVPTHYNRGGTTRAISALYILCIVVLLLGALLQWVARQPDRAKQTLIFALAGFVLFWLLRPWGLVIA